MLTGKTVVKPSKYGDIQMVKILNRLFTEDKAVAVAITFNAIVLFLLSFDELNPYHSLLTIIDSLFLFYFLLEAILKIRQLGWKGYISKNWNKFDFIILVFSFPSIILLFEESMPDVSILFVFRIVRLVRFFKFLRFIPNIEELIQGLSRAFRASVFVLLAFFIYMFVISMISCRIFSESSPEYFANPLISFYTIFKVFTIEGWYEIPENIPSEDKLTSFFIILYFIIIVVSGGLFGLSIVNAIFVDEMVSDNNDGMLARIDVLEGKIDKLLSLQKEEDFQYIKRESITELSDNHPPSNMLQDKSQA